MKILQFMPGSINKTLEAKNGQEVKQRLEAGQDFASILKTVSSQAGESGPGGAVSLENQRALQLTSQGDLGAAGRLLNLLKADIRAAKPESLKNVHNMEGLIYVYNKAGI